MNSMIDPNNWANPPLQILDANIDELPVWLPDFEDVPAWVIACVKAWAHGLVPVISGWQHIEHSYQYEHAFYLDGVEWCWRDDGDGVWTLVNVSGLFDEPY
ncbi:hypothetical protein [Sulfitobacter sp. 1A13679]|uniref:hypothetical protein n=1 Tax=Sulfitobacter sp. 1A13679 TaxID=3368597 RepID=UPI003745E7E6